MQKLGGGGRNMSTNRKYQVKTLDNKLKKPGQKEN